MTLKEKTKKEFNQFFTQLYLGNSTIIITVCWVISSSHLTMLYKFENCVNYCDDKNTFLYITYLSIIIIFSIFVPIIIYFYKNKNKIGIEKDPLIEEKSMSFGFSSRNPRVLILPMYLLWIFSLSKLIVIFYNKDFTEDFIIKIIILSIIFICSFIAWFKFKKTSNKTWSFWVTFFAVSYILINVFWEYFLQYLQSYFSTINCIFKTIITI